MNANVSSLRSEYRGIKTINRNVTLNGAQGTTTREQAAAAARLICYAAQEINELNVAECQPLLLLCVRWMQKKYQLSDSEVAGALHLHRVTSPASMSKVH